MITGFVVCFLYSIFWSGVSSCGGVLGLGIIGGGDGDGRTDGGVGVVERCVG